ncbi:MAG: GspH/FimT family protein [Gammaproteobacteria bacterium]|nr:GspH/FimT family protein [Gammaproteobacteria bacterium]
MNKKQKFHKLASDSGLTLLESLIILSIIAILAAIATASYSHFILNTRLENAANEIFTDLKLAKSQAFKQKKKIYVAFKGTGKNWCYGINEESACNCNAPATCKVNNVEMVKTGQSFNGIELLSAKFAGGGSTTGFDPNRGFAQVDGVKNGTIWLKASNDAKIAVIINRLGRVRFCSPTLPGYSRNCPKLPNE